MSKMKDETGN